MPSEDERAAVFQRGDFEEAALCRLANIISRSYEGDVTA